MEKKRLTKTMWYGSDVDHAGNPILPEAAASDNHLSGLNEGEIYIHNHPDNPSIWTRTTDGKIVSISGVDISVLEKLFLSKTKDDRSKGKIATDKGIEVGNYVSGASGAIIYKDAENGQTVAEFDKLYVRMKAYFETLEIINVNTIGGKQIISPAGSVKCIGVEETNNAYRCYFLAEQDGEKVQNRFLVNDQIYSQMFDAVEGTSQNVSTHYFWRLCIAKSKEPVTFENKSCHYIDLSKTDCDKDSDVPMVGDVLNQRGNRTDLDRMNFIEMSSVDAFSPNITLFHGVNSYSLDGKAYVSYGVDKSTNKAFMDVYGDMYVGDRQNSSYMRYTQENGLEISGTLSVGTKLGDTPLKDLISASSPEGYQEFVEKVTQDIEGLQAQIDGAIESYFFQYDPTLGNYPASEWITEEQKKAHLNDTFTNISEDSGHSWRWSLVGTTYNWVEIKDTATAKALQVAGQAKDTADGKRRVFVDTPYPPYDKGDLWSRGSEYPLMICVKTKDKNGVYEASDFDYADNNVKLKEEMQELVGDTKDELNNAIGQAKDEAVNNANAYTDEGKKSLQASIDAMESSKANLDDVYTRAQADGKISDSETKAINAAKEQADAAIALSEITIKAYADGIVDEEEAARIKQAQENLDAAKKYADEAAQQAIDEANDTYGYLARALDTEVDGGLLLTSLIQMRDTDQNIMSGINGLTAKGDKSIATWWGGGMYDMFDYYDWDGAKWVAKKNIQIPSNVPSGVIRMDGTGYLAKGKFWWDESGKIYADPTSLFLMFDVEDESASLSQTILAMRDKQTEFESMWEFKTDANGRKYLLSKYPLVTQEGITMYSGVGTTIPSIYDGLPIDGVTIYWENGILKAQGGGSEGINEEQLENYLTTNNYAKKSDIPSLSGYQPLITSSNKLAYSLISGTPTLLSSFTNDSGFITSSVLSDYLPLTGGTITGQVSITTTGSNVLLINSTVGNPAIVFKNNGANLARLTVSEVDGSFKRANSSWTKVYQIWDSQTFNPSDYLPKIGGELSGDITLYNNIKIYLKDASDTTRNGLMLNTYNDFVLGYGTSAAGYNTFLDGNNIYFRYGTSHTKGITLNSSGNVTIGSSDLAGTNYKLLVKGIVKVESGANIPFNIKSTNSVESSIAYISKDSVRWVAGQGTGALTDTFGIWSDSYGGNVLVCNSSGNMGVGTSTPSYKLDVNGTLGVSGATTLSSSLTMSGQLIIANNTQIVYKDSNGVNRNAIILSDSNILSIGYGTSGAGYSTSIQGNSIELKYGTSRTTGLSVASDGKITIAKNFAVSGSTTLQSLNATNGVFSGQLTSQSLSVNGGSLTYDSTNKSWKLNGNLLVTGGIAMYSDGSEIGGGGTGGGGSIDYPLKWSGFSSGSYDGSSTQTIYIPSKLSELTNDSGYALSSALSGYLPLSGGNIETKEFVGLRINSTDTAVDRSAIVFRKNGNNKTQIGWDAYEGLGSYLYNYASADVLGIKDNGTPYFYNGSFYTLYHTGNFNPSDYLPKSGGTITGKLNINGQLCLNSAFLLSSTDGNWKVTDKDWQNEYVLLHSSNYSSYALPLTGGKIKGVLKINGNNEYNIPLVIETPSMGDWGFIQFHTGVKVLGHIGVAGVDTPVFRSASGTNNTLIHSGNIGSQSVSYASSAGEASGLKSNNTTKSETKLSFYSSFVAKGDTTDFSWCSPTGSYTSGNTAGEWMSIIRINTGDGTTKYYHDLSFDMNSKSPQWRQVVSGYSQGWRKFAFEDSNVASATKLQTARTIWGQSFDGSSDISGGLSGVTSINSDGSVVLIGGATNNGSGAKMYTKGYIEVTDGYKINTLDVLRKKTDELAVGQETTVYASLPTSVYGTEVKLKYSTDRVTGLILKSSGNVGIGTTSPSYKLHVEGVIYAGTNIVSKGSIIADSGKDAVYFHGTGISWHNSSNSWTKDLFTYGDANDTLTLHRTTSVIGKATFTSSDGVSIYNDVSVGGNAIFANMRGVVLKDTNGASFSALSTYYNDIHLASGANSKKYSTYINGYGIKIRYGETAEIGFTLASDGTVTIAKYTSIKSGLAAQSLELSMPTPFIDFHFNNSTEDYTSRIIEESSGELTCKGKWKVGGALTASSTLSVSSTSTFTGNTTNKAIAYFANGTTYYVNASGAAKFASLTSAGAISGTSGSFSSTLAVTSTSTFTGKTTHNGGIGATSGTFSSTLAVTGATTLSSSLSVGSSLTVGTVIQAESIELVHSTPHIDFRFNKSTANYTSRFIEGLSGQLTCMGKFRIGLNYTTSTDYNFYVSGSAYISSNLLTGGSITMNSMRSMKNIINEVGLSLEELSTIKPTRFTWKDGRDDRIHVGGIADDVMKVLPEVVFKGSDGVLSMDYASAAFVMAASLIQPMTEHERRIANLERENALLKEEIRNLKSA